ncbi:HTH-type transcriptional activator Btr [compost metagenome]
MLNGRLLTWGPQRFLDGAAVAYTLTAANQTKVVQSAHLILIHLDAEPQWGRALNSDRVQRGIVPVGAIEIVGAGNEAFASWAGKKRSVRVDVDPARMARLAEGEFERADFEIQAPKLGLIDKKAYMFASLLQQELGLGDAASTEMLDALVTAFSIHTLRNYSSFSETLVNQPKGGLTPTIWRKIREFIHENLAQQLSMEHLAAIAGLSVSHFIRSFQKTIGQSPHQYVISARLAEARRLILNSELGFSEIAMLTGFSGHSHMTAMMKRFWGVTPSEIRRDLHR